MTPTRTSVLADLSALYDEALLRRGRQDLLTFVRVAWPILEPATPFQSDWHLELLCETLEAVTAGDIHRLVINIPPRYGKSLIVSVIWPVWEWLTSPSLRMLFVSASEGLAYQHSSGRRRLLEHDWIRGRFPQLRLMIGHQSRAEFRNVSQGAMVSMSLRGAILGKGGSRIILDDPQTVADVESDAWRQQTNDLFRRAVSTRLDDKRRGCIVLVQQRLHVDDLSAVCLGLGFHPLVLPALESEARRYVYPRSGRVKTRQRDEPLWPAREDAAALARQRDTMGTVAFNGHYLQKPEDPRGGLFDPAKFVLYDTLPATDDLPFVQAWDLAFKGSATSDYVVGLVGVPVGAFIYLVARFKARATYSQTKDAIRSMVQRYPTTRAVVIEEAANGAAIMDELAKEIPGLVGVTPQGGKHARAATAQARVEAGQVFIPNPATRLGDSRVERTFTEDFLACLSTFPNGRHDDDVDAFSHLVTYINQHLALAPAAAVFDPDPERTKRAIAFDVALEGMRRRRIGPLWRSMPLEHDADDEV